MPKIINHPKIGKVEVIIENETNYESGTKFFALIKTKAKPIYKEDHVTRYRPIIEKFAVKKIYGRETPDQHYVLWGNTPDFSDMGITHLLTPGLRPVRGSRPINMFFEIIRSAEFMQFINKTNIID